MNAVKKLFGNTQITETRFQTASKALNFASSVANAVNLHCKASERYVADAELKTHSKNLNEHVS